MSQHTEIEFKWILSASDHGALKTQIKGLLGEPAVLNQVNRFFDTADGTLREKRISLRLRRQNAACIVTCKRPVTCEDGLHRSLEDEEELSPEVFEEILGGGHHLIPIPKDVADIIGNRQLIGLGGFNNLRLKWDEGQDEICLDRTDFGNVVDYEMEVEVQDPVVADQVWSERLAAWGIKRVPQPQTKLQRYLAANETRKVD